MSSPIVEKTVFFVERKSPIFGMCNHHAASILSKREVGIFMECAIDALGQGCARAGGRSGM
jgi:hypothetical protein